jgi:hypothetical protein
MITAAFLMSGCGENETITDPTASATEDDVADLIANSLGGSQSTYGLTAQMDEVAVLVATSSLGKAGSDYAASGIMLDTLIVRADTLMGGMYFYHYTFRYTYTLSPSAVAFTYSMHGVYDSPRMASDDSADAALSVAIGPQSLVFNGSYDRLGSQTSKVRTQHRFTSRIMATITNVTFDRATRLISGGSAEYAISGQGDGGHAFTYVASLQFGNRNRRASLLVNGKSYTINLETGEVSS